VQPGYVRSQRNYPEVGRTLRTSNQCPQRKGREIMAVNLNMMQRRHLISSLFVDFLHTVVVVAAAGPRHVAGADILVPPYRQQDLQVGQVINPKCGPHTGRQPPLSTLSCALLYSPVRDNF
jgi:hypothetical protein